MLRADALHLVGFFLREHVEHFLARGHERHEHAAQGTNMDDPCQESRHVPHVHLWKGNMQ